MLAAGGTGGHVFPAQVLAKELGRRGRTVDIVTDHRGEDYADCFPGQSIHCIAAETVSGRRCIGKLVATTLIAQGTLQARRLIQKISPAAIVGFGGYTSLPTMVAAITLSVPRMLHEQNAVLGRVNRLIAARVDAIATSFPATKLLPEKENQPKFITGNPVRDEVRAIAVIRYDNPRLSGEFKLLIFGGSQGAGRFSNVVPLALAALPESYRRRLLVVQQCRQDDLEYVQSVYAENNIQAETASFFEDLPNRLAAAHLVIARSGAGTVSELAVAGRPSVLVPYPHATDDHQTRNAEVLRAVGGAWVLPEAEMTVERLSQHLTRLMDRPALLKYAAEAALGQGCPNAAGLLADVVESLAVYNLDGTAVS